MNQIRNIEWDLEDLEESVQIAETNRARYRLDAQELQSRRYFVTSTRQSIQDMRRAVMDPAVKQKKEMLQRDALLASTATMQEKDKYEKARRAVEEDNERFVENSQAQQQVCLAFAFPAVVMQALIICFAVLLLLFVLLCMCAGFDPAARRGSDAAGRDSGALRRDWYCHQRRSRATQSVRFMLFLAGFD